MNLQALYDLKERLEHAAIAGTGLLPEDFRLRRAVEALAPLAQASPVFAKISSAAKALLAAPPEARSTRLLDVLSLVDAVVYTQGVTNLPGELEPIQPGQGRYVRASYGQLQPLLSALSGTGSGRTTLIRQYWAEHPEYFGDFRVLPHVVDALGDSYTELAELIGAILMKQGTSIIPLLKAGFDPEGKAEMTRRVRLVAKLAGWEENAWFLSILPNSKKDVREAVIQALGLSTDNAQCLLDLCRSERGKLKETAMRSLAMVADEEGVAFWKKEAAKRPKTVHCLGGVGSTLAADLTADALRAYLEELLEKEPVYDQTALDSLTKLAGAACGKYSEKMEQLWRWIAEHMDRFDTIIPNKVVRSSDMSVAAHLQKTFLRSILWDGGTEILALARDLSLRCREWFLAGVFLADMGTLSAAQLYERYGPLIVRTGLLKPETKQNRSDRIQILRGLAAVRWNESIRAYCAEFARIDALTGQPIVSARKLDGLDSRWIQLLTDSKVKTDGGLYDLTVRGYHQMIAPAGQWLLSRLIDRDDPAVCEAIGTYLYTQMMNTGDLTYLQELVRCGWKNWKGFLAHCARKQGQLSLHGMMAALGQLPLSNVEQAAQLRELDALAKSNTVQIQYNRWPRDLQRTIEALESAPDRRNES